MEGHNYCTWNTFGAAEVQHALKFGPPKENRPKMSETRFEARPIHPSQPSFAGHTHLENPLGTPLTHGDRKPGGQVTAVRPPIACVPPCPPPDLLKAPSTMQGLGGLGMGGPTTFGAHGGLGNQTAPCCSLFVKGLAKGVNERQLHAIFSAFGSVIDCQVARHRSGRSAGFAVVTYFRREDAQRALLVMESAVLAGRRLNVRWYTPELQNTMGMGELSVAQALAAMLGGQTQAKPQQTPQQHQAQQQLAAANATQLLVQQLASAVAASRTAGVGMPGATQPDSWAALTVTNQATASPRMQQSFAMGISAFPDVSLAKKSPPLSGAWLDNDTTTGGQGQLDSWARHSIDTSAPTYGPRRRSSQNCSRLSIEGLDLSACSAATSTHEETASDGQADDNSVVVDVNHMRESSKWSVPRSGSSADSCVPISPQNQSDDGSCRLNKRHDMNGKLHNLGPDCNGHSTGHVDIIREEFSEGTATLHSLSSIHLPPNLDSDSLFDRQPSLTSSALSSLRTSGTNVPTLKPKSSVVSANGSNATAFPVPGGSLVPQPPNGPIASPGGPPRANTAQQEIPQMDLAAALGLSALSLDSPNLAIGPNAGMPSHMHMEAAIRQAQQADQMIAQLSAMRSQALLAYHAAAALQQPPAPFSANQGMHACMMGPGPAQGAGAPGSLEAMIAAGALSPSNLDSLSALVMQQGLHHGVY